LQGLVEDLDRVLAGLLPICANAPYMMRSATDSFR